MHPQIELVKELVRLIFKEQEYSFAILLCKNPKLLSLLSCEFGKIKLSSPYPVGTNFYYPISDTGKYSKVTVKEITEIQGDTWYKFSIRKGKKPVCQQFKRLEDFESDAILARDQESTDWVKGNNVSTQGVYSHSGSSFPTVISQVRSFEETIRDPSLRQLMDLESVASLTRKIKFSSENKIEPEYDKNRVWINKIPYNIDNNNIVLLSTTHSRYMEFKADIESLFARSEFTEVVKLNDLPPKLKKLAEITSGTNPLSIWRGK